MDMVPFTMVSESSGNCPGEDIVLICDGVRSMITSELVSNCIREAGEYENAVPVTPSIDSVLESF